VCGVRNVLLNTSHGRERKTKEGKMEGKIFYQI